MNISSLPFLIIYSGNCRTFNDCFESQYKHLIYRFKKFHIYFYLKLDDPGPKGQEYWNFSYEPQTREKIINTINKRLAPEVYTLNIIETDELSKDELIGKVKNLDKYIGFFNTQAENEIIDPKWNRPVNNLSRAMNCHYNLYKCGEFIENFKLFKPAYIIYIRPDLEFTNYIAPSRIDKRLITLNTGPNETNIDHLAVIPYRFYRIFFINRFLVYCENDNVEFSLAEDIYLHTIGGKFKIIPFISYFIKRT